MQRGTNLSTQTRGTRKGSNEARDTTQRHTEEDMGMDMDIGETGQAGMQWGEITQTSTMLDLNVTPEEHSMIFHQPPMNRATPMNLATVPYT